MENKYLQSACLAIAILIPNLLFSQGRQPSIPNFTNPFNSKTQQDSIKAIKPTPNQSVSRVSHQNHKSKIEKLNGSVRANFQNQGLSKEAVTNNITSLLNLDEQYTFRQISEKTDELGIVHTNFQQLYKGYVVEGNILLLHSKNGIANYLNGKIVEIENVETNTSITAEVAKETAKRHLKVTKTIKDYPVETLIVRIPSENGFDPKLAYKVRLDSYSPFTMCYVYVDVKTGEVINKINLIAHADTPGTGQTLYSGNQAITVDSHSGAFRLREGGRKIETYNATNATELTEDGFIGSTDFTSSTTTFTGIQQLSSFNISTVAQTWWYAAFADELPELYIKIKDGTNQIVYTSGYIENSNAPIIFNDLNIYLTNPPYSVEVWDYDVIGDDDFGGTYPIVTTLGTQLWSGNGNSGSYSITTSGNPALDVHWGMEESFDFYQSVFNRNSYDGSGSVIKQYINPPTLQSQYGYSPNNASAYPAPYNLMQYGLGDGVTMNPVVGLDVEGHEFTHMVVANNGNGGLVYESESGALNESFADIFGVCIEFYSGVNADWLMGEDIMVSEPYLRSMSDPNGGQQPDTYGGQYWANPANLDNDHGGVHINSGVQNYWFYLLSEGGSGTNDLGNPYTVAGIGIEQARQIAYRNLITYLGPNATYVDAYNGSLQAAEDLYGNPSTQYTAVRQAWYAVGLGNDPNSYCSGTTNLITSTGTISDGSGVANYNSNANCKWIIAPSGATQISLNFTEFDTETDYDIVYVYDGPDDTYPVLATWWGNTLPPTITTTSGVGAICIKFTSDADITAGGWSANFTSIGSTPTCEGGTVLANSTGSITDGSSGSNYGNNQKCYWFISPPCATSITLSFSEFNTEQDYDGVIIYDDFSGSNQLAVLTGTNLPTPVTSNTGKMLVVFISDYSTSMQGFSASYTSTGSAFCSGLTNLNSLDFGTVSDGSTSNNYCSNLDCQWLIQPPQAITVTLNFTEFDLEAASPDGQTIYDAVEVYDGTTINAPLLGRFAGNNLPPALTSSGGSLLIRFFTDIEENRQGWSAYYTSTQNSYCSGTTNLSTSSGTFNDGSVANQYSNNSNCSWLIQPENANSITLSFSSFSTELNYDGVIVYDGDNNTAPVLGQFSGPTLPSDVTSTGGSMYVEFVSDPAVRGDGWTANYTSTIITGIGEDIIGQNLKMFPNPTEGIFTINSGFADSMTLQIMDVLGKRVLKTYIINKGPNEIDASELSKGIYLAKFRIGDSYHTERLIFH